MFRAALADGRIDAAAMTFEGAMINRLADVASHSLELNVNTVTFGLVMNKARYGALAPDLQAVVADVLGARAALRLAAKLAEAVDEGRRYMRDGGVRIVQLSSGEQDRVKSLLKSVSRATIEELESKGLAAEAVRSALMAVGLNPQIGRHLGLLKLLEVLGEYHPQLVAQARRDLRREQPHALAREIVAHVTHVELDQQVADLGFADQIDDLRDRRCPDCRR